uniref:Uncharacterized protein n=1 Tax=Anguilla anguilla TaxID=7936 RepID=A0A0E9WIT4_ANGAN
MLILFCIQLLLIWEEVINLNKYPPFHITHPVCSPICVHILLNLKVKHRGWSSFKYRLTITVV